MKDLGPVEVWGRRFREGYDRACADVTAGRTTQEAIDKYMEQVEAHADIGRMMLARLLGSSIIKPPTTHEEWGDILIVSDVLGLLHRGVAILEARLEIFAPEGALPCALVSNTRRHEGFESML